MKSVTFLIVTLFISSLLYSQSMPSAQQQETALTPEECYDLIKTNWDELKKISDDFRSDVAVKSEFESTAQFNQRVRKSQDEFINKVRKYSNSNKLSDTLHSVWMKADLVKYDADRQVYGVTSSTKISVQPSRDDIAVICPPNKYVSIVEDNSNGYRHAYIELKTDPEFSWFVDRSTAESAKNKEREIYFNVTFSLSVSVNEKGNTVNLEIRPYKLALMDKPENFTYWSETLR